MRSIFYIDPSISQDQTYVEYLKEEIPKRLRLLEAEYSASPWTVTFADDEYGDSDLEGFTQNLSRYHDSADAVIILPDPNKIESDYGLESSKVLKSGYMRQIQTLVSQASSHGLPVLAYLEEPGPRAEFNLITSGISSVVDHVADPGLLPLKIARAVNKGIDATGVLSIGHLSVDMKSGQTFYGDKQIHPTATEKALFLSLLRHRGSVRSKEGFMRDLYQLVDSEPDMKIVDVFITKLRRKLNEAAPGLGFDLIRTDWGGGFFIPEKIPDTRKYYGLLRLDRTENGNYKIADTTIILSDAELEVFDHLYVRAGKTDDLESNFMKANNDTLAQLEDKLSKYLVAFGTPIEIDREENTVRLNMAYFDIEKFEASDFTSLLKQDIIAVGPYRFLRQSGVNAYVLQGTEEAFNRSEVKLLEHLYSLPNQAVRARVLFNQIRGANYKLRGQLSVDEDIMSLARGVYKKLESLGFNDEDTRIHFYHDEFISFGPAEEIPDPEILNEERKERVRRMVVSRLENASGKNVALAPVDFGYFSILVHPNLGEGVIEGTSISFTAEQVKILKLLSDSRPGFLTKEAIHDKIFPNRPFNPLTINNKIMMIRSMLRAANAEGDRLLTHVRDKGYVSLFPGEDLPEYLVKPRRTTQSPYVPRIKPELAEPEEIALHGGVTLLRRPDAGNSVLKGTQLVLNKSQTAVLLYLSENYPRTIYEQELVRETGIKNIKPVVKRTVDDFTNFIRQSPIYAGATGYRWQDIAIPDPDIGAEKVDTKLERLFAFVANGDFMCRCENNGLDFTVREAELLSILDERRGQTIDPESIRESALKFKWPDNIIEQTANQIGGKLKDTPIGQRLVVEKKKGGPVLLTMH